MIVELLEIVISRVYLTYQPNVVFVAIAFEEKVEVLIEQQLILLLTHCVFREIRCSVYE